jgi:hypothetical protein
VDSDNEESHSGITCLPPVASSLLTIARLNRTSLRVVGRRCSRGERYRSSHLGSSRPFELYPLRSQINDFRSSTTSDQRSSTHTTGPGTAGRQTAAAQQRAYAGKIDDLSDFIDSSKSDK